MAATEWGSPLPSAFHDVPPLLLRQRRADPLSPPQAQMRRRPLSPPSSGPPLPSSSTGSSAGPPLSSPGQIWWWRGSREIVCSSGRAMRSRRCRRFSPVIRKWIAQAIDLGWGSWNQEHEGDMETQNLYRFRPPEHNILRPCVGGYVCIASKKGYKFGKLDGYEART